MARSWRQTEAICWLGELDETDIPLRPQRDAFRLLGQELSLLIFDAHCGFDPDAFGAASGSVIGGGLLLLLAPRLDQWAQLSDPTCTRIATYPFTASEVGNRYLRRLGRLLHREAEITEQQGTRPAFDIEQYSPPARPTPSIDRFRTADQAWAVGEILDLAHGAAAPPLLLLAARGRGKSAALGIAAAELLATGRVRVGITAPSAAAVAAGFERLRAHAQQIDFFPPERLVADPPDLDLLLVDEAAAIPLGLLEPLLRQFPRICFASTVEGYEGSGRGLLTRFRAQLDRLTPGWRTLHLTTPIRWSADDPLEPLIARLLLLDAEPATLPPSLLSSAALSPRLERIERERLVEDETLLRELFGLLVTAHYRTTPFDLRQLLDGPSLSLWLLWIDSDQPSSPRQRRVAGVLLLAEEGELDDQIAEAIYQGGRRPRGHLLPQTLLFQLGIKQAAAARYARVVRIAIHPALQRRGLGSRALDQLIAQLDGFDLLGCSFSAAPELLRFWRRAALAPIRLGDRVESRSGERALLMLRPLSAHGESLFRRARRRFLNDLPLQLGDSLSGVEPDLLLGLFAPLAQASDGVARISDQGTIHLKSGANSDDHLRLTAFIDCNHTFEAVQPALWRYCAAALISGRLNALAQERAQLLLMRLLQRRSESEVASALGITGRRQLIEALRQATAELIRTTTPAP